MKIFQILFIWWEYCITCDQKKREGNGAKGSGEGIGDENKQEKSMIMCMFEMPQGTPLTSVIA